MLFGTFEMRFYAAEERYGVDFKEKAKGEVRCLEVRLVGVGFGKSKEVGGWRREGGDADYMCKK